MGTTDINSVSLTELPFTDWLSVRATLAPCIQHAVPVRVEGFQQSPPVDLFRRLRLADGELWGGRTTEHRRSGFSIPVPRQFSL